MEAPFLQPAATAFIRRWGETLAAGGLAALGAWWFIAAGGILAWVGLALALGAAAAAVAAFRRARFRAGGGGVGVVQLDEGRLTYFGPLTGGTVAVDEIASVAINPRHRPAHWVLSGAGTELFIPVDAEGAGVLVDLFAQLPGLDLGAVVAASDGEFTVPTMLWRRTGVVAKLRRLH